MLDYRPASAGLSSTFSVTEQALAVCIHVRCGVLIYDCLLLAACSALLVYESVAAQWAMLRIQEVLMFSAVYSS
jgi:pyrroloquinoline quinone (PQQ) biosynthesis protein C